jgi:hypothetical protein
MIVAPDDCVAIGFKPSPMATPRNCRAIRPELYNFLHISQDSFVAYLLAFLGPI